MHISTTGKLPHRKMKQTLGLVSGSVIRTRWIGMDIAAFFRLIVGGEVKGYSEMISSARKEALEKMIKQAENLNADAIIGMRYSTTTVMGGAAEILAYGTAVKLEYSKK